MARRKALVGFVFRSLLGKLPLGGGPSTPAGVFPARPDDSVTLVSPTQDEIIDHTARTFGWPRSRAKEWLDDMPSDGPAARTPPQDK